MERIVGVYHDGKVEVLGEHHLEEGQQVEISAAPQMTREEARRRLAPILAKRSLPPDYDPSIDLDALQAEIDATIDLDEPLSEVIIRMRGEA